MQKYELIIKVQYLENIINTELKKASSQNHYQQYSDAFADQILPLAYVDMDFLDENIANIISRCGNKTVRIATKSIRSVEIIQYLLSASPVIQGVMCYSAGEMVYLASHGVDDLLLAYPTAQAKTLRPLIELSLQGKTISIMVDCVEQLEVINAIAAELNVEVNICIDVDMSMALPGIHFGVKRSPINSLEKLTNFCLQLEKFSYLKVDGLMGYEAQIAGLVDAMPGQQLKNLMVRYLKKRSIKQIKKRRQEAVQFLQQKGHSLGFVNGGGTGSLESTREEDWVTEITVGSGFYNPHLFDNYQNFTLLPAAGFALEVCRQPEQKIVTCHGGGYIASGATGNEKQPSPYLPEGIALLNQEGAGEVQTPILCNNQKLHVGDMVFFRHSKAGELCERFNQLHCLRHGKLTHTVSTYRGDGQCFL